MPTVQCVDKAPLGACSTLPPASATSGRGPRRCIPKANKNERALKGAALCRRSGCTDPSHASRRATEYLHTQVNRTLCTRSALQPRCIGVAAALRPRCGRVAAAQRSAENRV